MRTVDPQRHRQRRLQIINAAVELFAANGFDRTTTAEVCARAGMSPGNLFHYFPNKRAIFVGIFEFDRDEWDAAFTAARAIDDPWRALMTLVDKIADDASSPLVSGLMVEVLAQAHHDAAFAALLAENDRRMTDCFAELLDAAASHGMITPTMPSLVLARWIAILTDGLYGRGYAEPNHDPAADLATVKQLIARMAGRQP